MRQATADIKRKTPRPRDKPRNAVHSRNAGSGQLPAGKRRFAGPRKLRLTLMPMSERRVKRSNSALTWRWSIRKSARRLKRFVTVTAPTSTRNWPTW